MIERFSLLETKPISVGRELSYTSATGPDLPRAPRLCRARKGSPPGWARQRGRNGPHGYAPSGRTPSAAALPTHSCQAPAILGTDVTLHRDPPRCRIALARVGGVIAGAAASAMAVSNSAGAPDVAVPDVLGLPALKAAYRIDFAQLKPLCRDAHRRGTVVEQHPAAGTHVARGSVVVIFSGDGDCPAVKL